MSNASINELWAYRTAVRLTFRQFDAQALEFVWNSNCSTRLQSFLQKNPWNQSVVTKPFSRNIWNKFLFFLHCTLTLKIFRENSVYVFKNWYIDFTEFLQKSCESKFLSISFNFLPSVCSKVNLHFSSVHSSRCISSFSLLFSKSGRHLSRWSLIASSS